MPHFITADEATKLLRKTDIETGEVVCELALEHAPYHLALSTNDDCMLAVATAGGLVLVDQESLAIARSMAELGHTRSVSYSLDGRWLACAGNTRTVNLMSSSDYSVVTDSKLHKSTVFSVHFSPSSGLLASGSDDNTINVYSVPDLTKLQTLSGHQDTVRGVLFLSNTELATCSDDGSVLIWNVDDGSILQTISDNSSFVLTLELSPDKSMFASGSFDDTVSVYSTATYERLHRIECGDDIYRLAFVDDETIIAGVSGHPVVKIDVTKGAIVQTYDGQRVVRGIVISGSGLFYVCFLAHSINLFPNTAPTKLVLPSVII